MLATTQGSDPWYTIRAVDYRFQLICPQWSVFAHEVMQCLLSFRGYVCGRDAPVADRPFGG